MEKDNCLYNWTSCLRHEYKCFDELESALQSMHISIKIDSEYIARHEKSEHPDEYELQMINESKAQIIIAQESILQIEEEMTNFPRYPELPPTKPLIKISGILEAVSFKKVIGYFEASQYSTEIQRAEQKRQRDNNGAILLLLVQFFSGAAPLARFNDGRRKQYKCLYIKGIIAGKVFSGWLNKTNIQIGDYLEMAVMPDGDEYRMYAVANPQQNTISLPPECHGGTESFPFKIALKINAVLFFLFSLPFIVFGSPNAEQWFYIILIYLTATAAMSYAVYRGEMNARRATGNLFEKICTVLNIEGSKNLDLVEYTRIKLKKMQKNNELMSGKSESRVMPQSSTSYSEDNFYFYPPVKKTE
ncbi:putative type VI secretion system effector [Acerihabitans sp. TG2]|uniref:putative type VI secretion system effector n=1 Tax=Acerihabitans sp. TG2 TaxID=3096008 RepID=UPI002B225B91|nr:putative type VI secretion system effector [Acerihabitans sp. TG2]MEA9393067.1 putative type VI secretion system effector [Acerihabitans sp. TG2]